jgi:hypothetical protein
MTRYLESAAARNQEDSVARVLESGSSGVTVTALKGVGAIRNAPLNTLMAADLATVDVSWYYDWAYNNTYNSDPTFPPLPATPGVQYVPMIWGDWELYGDDPPSSGISGAQALLGFNEPDDASQSNMTVARALTLWPQLESTGLPLGSPAPGGSGGGLAWLSSFMAGSGPYVPRVDFICCHWYSEYNSGYANIGDFLDYFHTTYPGKPVWLTEVGSLLGGASAQAALMPTVFAALETRPWVERIAWFVLHEPASYGWPGAGLINPSNAITVAGTTYATYPPGEIPGEAVPIAGTADGVSTTTGTLSIARALSGVTPAGQSTTTGALSVARTLAGTSGGLSTTTGALAVGRALAGTSTGVSTDSGVMAVARALAGTSTGLSTTTGDLEGSSAATLDGSAAGLSTTTGTLSVVRGLVGQSDGLSTAGATAMAAQRVLVGSAGGLSTTTAALARAVPMDGASGGASTASATTLATAGLPGGVSTGASTTTGTLAVARALAGSATGASTVTGAVARAVPVAGSAAGLSTTTGTLTVAKTLVGSASGISTAGGTALTVARSLAGSTTGGSTTTGSLIASAAGGMAGFAAGSGDATGSLSVARPLAGTSGGVSGASATSIAKAIPLASVSAVGVASAFGSIGRGVSLSATSDGVSTTAADTRVSRALVGTSSGGGAADGRLNGSQFMAGSSSGTSNATGTLQAIRIEKIYGLWNGQPFESMQYGEHQVIDWLMIPS